MESHDEKEIYFDHLHLLPFRSDVLAEFFYPAGRAAYQIVTDPQLGDPGPRRQQEIGYPDFLGEAPRCHLVGAVIFDLVCLL